MTLSVVAGAAAALAFGVSTLCSAAASRAIGAGATVGWVALVGLVIVLPPLALSDVPAGLDAQSVGWLVLAGAGNAAGLLFAYRGVRQANVAIVAPILSTEGAVAAVLAVVGGQALRGSAAALLLPRAPVAHPARGGGDDRRRHRRAQPDGTVSAPACIVRATNGTPGR